MTHARTQGEFLIDLPWHKRWRLPDGVHLYNSVLHGDAFHISIIHSVTGESRDMHTVRIDACGEWKRLLEVSQECAGRKYRRKPRDEHATRMLGMRRGAI